MEVILFLTFAVIAVACAVNLVIQTHPIASAVSLIGVMGSLAVIYLQLGAEFIAAVQVIVYAGAIMVLFVFVIMLLNAGAEKPTDKSRAASYLGIPLLIVLVGLMSLLIRLLIPSSSIVTFGGFMGGTPRNIGRLLFTSYLLPFEVVSVLILVAILGAIVLAHKEID